MRNGGSAVAGSRPAGNRRIDCARRCRRCAQTRLQRRRRKDDRRL